MDRSSQAARTQERRALERMQTALRGKVFPGPLDCVIKDYNTRGARLRFDARPTIGDHIVVVIWSSGLAFEAAPRWRTQQEAGVEFVRTCDFRRPVPAHLAHIRAQWLMRRPRVGRRDLIACPALIQSRPERRVPGRYRLRPWPPERSTD